MLNLIDPLLRRYQAQRNSGKDTTDLTVSGVSRSEQPIAKKFAYPLIFEPGEGWEYSVGIDWAGQMGEPPFLQPLFYSVLSRQPPHYEQA